MKESSGRKAAMQAMLDGMTAACMALPAESRCRFVLECLKAAPKDALTEEFCLFCVSKNGLALREIPEELKTPRVCAAAVGEFGGALPLVPEDRRTLDICARAVAGCPWTVAGVPDWLLGSQEALAAIFRRGEMLNQGSSAGWQAWKAAFWAAAPERHAAAMAKMLGAMNRSWLPPRLADAPAA